jgi:hypothetical protein
MQNTALEAGPTWRSLALALASVLTLTLAGSLARAQDANVRPLVIEMFTSQGCSSCPPADRLINQMARKPGVFALSLPVDYWDYIGWKDTLALPAHSNRQRQYARARGDSNVYTPQAVIDGIAHVVGSDPGAILRMAEECYGKEGALLVAINAKAQGAGLRVELGAGTGEGPHAAILWLVRVASKSKVLIGRGENSGKTVEYSNVSRGFMRIGEWSGQAATFDIPQAQVAGADSDGWMVLLQAESADKPGVILAAAKSDGL